MVLKFTGIQVSTTFLSEFPLSVGVHLDWASGRWPPHARSFARKVITVRVRILILQHNFSSCPFTGIVVDIASALA